MKVDNILRKAILCVCVVATFSSAETSFAQCGRRGCGWFGGARRAASYSPSCYRYAPTCGSYGGDCSTSSCAGGTCRVPESIPTPESNAAPTCYGGVCTTQVAAQQDLDAKEKEVVDAINAERKQLGIAPLVLDSRLSDGARRLAEANARSGRPFHWSGSLGFCGGEICASGETALEAVRMWLASPGHASLMTSTSYSRASVGVAARTYRCGGREYTSYSWVVRVW